jgi:hypothetical protein
MPSSINRKLRDQGLEPRHINLHLRYEAHPTQHFCFFCRSGLFKSQYRAIGVLHGEGIDESYMTPPISIQCHTCGTFYHLQGLNK